MVITVPVCIAGYAAAVNVAAFAVMAADKSRARKGAWRVPERTLFLLALFFGSIGIWAGMYVFRHKTKHLKFVIGIPAIFLVQLCAVLAFIFWI